MDIPPARLETQLEISTPDEDVVAALHAASGLSRQRIKSAMMLTSTPGHWGAGGVPPVNLNPFRQVRQAI
ncbi:MAG: hypothetical protein WBN34_06360 [Woeseia sp.]